MAAACFLPSHDHAADVRTMAKAYQDEVREATGFRVPGKASSLCVMLNGCFYERSALMKGGHGRDCLHEIGAYEWFIFFS